MGIFSLNNNSSDIKIILQLFLEIFFEDLADI